MVQDGNYPGQSPVVFFQMLDLSQSDMSCVYSTFHYLAVHAQKIENDTNRHF